MVLILCNYNIIQDNFTNTDNIAFYTCYFGDDIDFITEIPLLNYDFYYFTNNTTLLKNLKNSDWIPVLVNIPIKETENENAMDSKYIKALPHKYNILNNYDFTCYLDNKLSIDGDKVINLINTVFENPNILYVMCKHPTTEPHIWNEYNDAINYQERYYIEKDKYYDYINKQLDDGAEDTLENHYQTGFIIRKKDSKTNEINQEWYNHILECGIECQISFFFIQQLYKFNIYPISIYDVYL